MDEATPHADDVRPDDAAGSADNSDGPPKSLDRATAERLALIRYLASVADQQSRGPETVCSIAVMTMHDAVELLLHLVAQHADPPLDKRHREFAQYFQDIAVAKPAWQLTGQQRMSQLNTARVALKHHGVRPSRGAVAELLTHVERFLSDNTRLVFGVPLESVSVVDLIRFPLTRGHLHDAETSLSQGDTGNATIALVQGFHAVIDEYEHEARRAHGRSPFAFADDFTFDRSVYRRGVLSHDPFAPNDQGEFEDRIIGSIGSLEKAVKMLSLGLDYRRYARFRLLTPPVHLLPMPGKGGPQLALGVEDGWPPSDSDCRFCLQFAIDSALQLQEVVFTEPSWRLGMNP